MATAGLQNGCKSTNACCGRADFCNKGSMDMWQSWLWLGLGYGVVKGKLQPERSQSMQQKLDRPIVLGMTWLRLHNSYKSSRWLTAMTIDANITGVSHLDVIRFLESHDIESRPLWKPMHLQPIYNGTPYHGSGFDASLFNSGICLPSCSDLTEDDQDKIINLITSIL